jgi:hypothetical protein
MNYKATLTAIAGGFQQLPAGSGKYYMQATARAEMLRAESKRGPLPKNDEELVFSSLKS